MTEKKDTRISEITEAALNEFIEKGYENASMEGIASRANLSKGGLYHHFRSKTEILFAVNMKFMEPIGDLAMKIGSAPTVGEGLKQFIADYLHYWSDHRKELSLYFFTMNISFNNKLIMDYYRVVAKSFFDFIEQCIIKGQTQEKFKERNARSHAVALISCLDGFLAYMLIDPSLQPDKIIAEIQSTFIDDLLK
jgi:AcrR family transcriptional regulator